MKTTGFRYAVEVNTLHGWRPVVSGDDRELVGKMFSKQVETHPKRSARFVDRATDTVFEAHTARA